MLKWIIVVLVLIGGGVWFVSGRGQLPGEAVADQGREHWDHTKLDEFKYNSNPPVSGPHDPDWIRPGIYNEPQDKYKLIHSLEHGYVVVHYNCGLPISNSIERSRSASEFLISKASAHEEDNATPSANANPECSLGQILAEWAKKMELKKLIVQFNPTIDKPIILTAWDRMLKMDAWDEKLAEKFVKSFRNKGPEATLE